MENEVAQALGRHLGYKSLSRRCKEALERAELRELRFHDRTVKEEGSQASDQDR